MNKKISVLMTVYNAEKYVANSVQSILLQKYKNFELIIIDDLSTDRSVNILKKIKDKRIKFYSLKKKLGRTKALNFALSKSNSNIIAIQDADDVSHKDRFAQCMDILTKNKNIGLVATDFRIIDKNGNILSQSEKYLKINKIKRLKFINTIAHSSIIFQRNKLKNCVYNESYVYAQDYELILRFLKYSKIKLLKNNLLKIRTHSENMSNDKIYSTIIIKENLRLLNFSSNKLNLSTREKNYILFMKIKNYFKLVFIYLMSSVRRILF